MIIETDLPWVFVVIGQIILHLIEAPWLLYTDGNWLAKVYKMDCKFLLTLYERKKIACNNREFDQRASDFEGLSVVYTRKIMHPQF